MAAQAEVINNREVVRHDKSKRRERLFYTGMTVAFVLTVFAGFSRTYFLKILLSGSTARPTATTSWNRVQFMARALSYSDVACGRQPDANSPSLRNRRRCDCRADGHCGNDDGYRQG